MTPPEIKPTKGKLLETSRELGKTHPLDWTKADQPSLSQPLGEVADAWDGRKPGSRPTDESDALYRYMDQSSYLRDKQDDIQQAKHDQRVETLKGIPDIQVQAVGTVGTGEMDDNYGYS